MLILEESAKQEFTDVDSNNPNCVLIGLSPSSFYYEKLDQAFKLGKKVTRLQHLSFTVVTCIRTMVGSKTRRFSFRVLETLKIHLQIKVG